MTNYEELKTALKQLPDVRDIEIMGDEEPLDLVITRRPVPPGEIVLPSKLVKTMIDHGFRPISAVDRDETPLRIVLKQ